MASNYSKSLYKDYENLINKFEKQEQLLNETKELVKSLNKIVNSLKQELEAERNEKEKYKQEVLRLKAKNDKDSSNSSKPSSTNGYKKVIINRREKSNRSKGGQKNHQPHSLNNKLEQFINSENVHEEIIEINKNELNKNKRYIEKVVIDIQVTKEIKRYRYYPHADGKYYIPEIHNQYVQYGPTVKAISIDLMNNLYNSTDGVTRFIEDITNGGITLSKGTLVNWNKDLSLKLNPEIENIEEKLLDSYYLNHDESQIKINGDGHNIRSSLAKRTQESRSNR